MKLIERSRIKKNAENKISALENSLKLLQRDGPIYNALIYVDNETFLSDLQRMLTSNNIRTTKFTGENKLNERLLTIDNLRKHSINAIIAIKCLDEGVDIPSAKTAFFLSNNTDPREYVQRLGRVLRLDNLGDKKMSEIYDYVVIPPSGIVYEDETDRNIARNMIKNEIIRSKFFNELASNAREAQDTIDDAVDKYSFYYEENELTYNTGED
jgi:superfamily II DNA or RNA helicase